MLKNIKLNIKGVAKIGVAGRTGAGKSFFVAALMPMPESCGEVIIDGIPIKAINLQETRRCIFVLGQSPVLFSGSLRKNLDLDLSSLPMQIYGKFYKMCNLKNQ